MTNNSFFKNPINFKKRKAIIINKNKFFTYDQVFKQSKILSDKVSKEKKLIFILAENNIETIIGYISFINKGHAIALLDHRTNRIFINDLIKKYSPDFVYCPNKLQKNILNYDNQFVYKNYSLLKRKIKKSILLSENLMLLMSTSGSTGSPKFVRLSYKNLISNSKRIIQYLKIKKKDITITSLPISYVYGLSVINTHLLKGASIVLTNRSMIEKDFWKLVNSCKVNNFSGVPYNYSIIDKIFKNNLPKTINYSTQAGGKMNLLLLKKIISKYKTSKIRLLQMYGAAEATSRMSYLNWKDAEHKLGSIGKPIPGGKFYIVGRDGKKIKTPYKSGELIYKGPNVFMGYAKNLKDLSLSDLNRGLLKTGDIAYKDKNGFYYIVGRKDRYVKIYGIRVDLSELETIFLKKGVNVNLKKGDENKIDVLYYKITNIKKTLEYVSRITSININVFVLKKITKKSLTYNYKLKL